MKIRHIGLIGTALLTLFLAAWLSADQKNDQADVALKAAIKTETVDGNLKNAIDQYKAIAALPGAGRATVATALLRMGQCHEKLGNTEARVAYERLVREFGDQAGIVAQARARLAVLADPGTAGAEMTIRRVWSGSSEMAVESPSPDGKYLSIMDPESGGLALWDIMGGQKRRLANKGSESNPELVLDSAWSPDGKKIAYAWMNKSADLELAITGSDGSEARILGAAWPLDWSPDGRFLLALIPRNNNNRVELALVSTANGSSTPLGAAGKPISSWKACYSEDGKFIVYDIPQQEGSSEHDIFMISVDGKQGFPLVKHPAHDQLFGWVPGSDTVLFSSDRTGTQDAWALHVAGGKPQGEPVLVRKEIGEIKPIGFSDRGSFFYSLGSNIVDVFEASLDWAKGTVAEPPKKIIQRVGGTNYSAEWSPDGKSLAYVSERKAGSASQSSYVLCLRSDQTGEEREIPLSTSSFWRMHWAADSGAVFATMGDETSQGLFKIDIQTGKQTLLARSGWSDSLIKDFAVSPDGKSVFYAHFQWVKKRTPIIKFDLETGQEREVYRNTGMLDIGGMTFSPGGKYLSFSTQHSLAEKSFVIRIVPTAGGETRDLLQGKLETFARHVWTPDGKTILFIKRMGSAAKDERELWQVDSTGGEPKKINLGMEPREMQLHPDGRRIIFTSGKNIREIWVMENFLPPAKAIK